VTTIRNTIKTQFPTLHHALEKIHAGGETVASKLGKLETKIFRDTFANETRFQLSMHDGLLVLSEDLNYFMEAIQAQAQDVLGYHLKLKVETLKADDLADTIESRP
jgi:hypothetical protein